MKIAITGGKGGTGKSMVATSLAVEYAKNKKTLLLDLDVECPNDHLLLSIKREINAKIFLTIPKWNFKKCNKCGKCAQVCKQNAVVFVKNKFPAFVQDTCIGCKACIFTCPQKAITESKKQIGTIYTGKKYNVNLISGELKLGELASGEVVTDVRNKAKKICNNKKAEIELLDSAAGIGCPVIASLVDTDYIIAVTEPTPSALQDLKRVLYLANHFQIKHGIIINKYDIAKNFCQKIEKFARQKNIKVIGKIPYDKNFVKATVTMEPIVKKNPEYQQIFETILKQIKI